MAAGNDAKGLKNRSEGVANLPIPALALEPLPPELIRAFPAMAEWEKRNNARIAEWVGKQNTIQQNAA